MEINHRVSFHSQEVGVEEAVAHLGIDYEKSPLPGGSNYLGHFDIRESDSRWAQVAELIRAHELPDFPATTFAVSEVLVAEWLRLMVVFERGYPQPEATWRKLTYEGGCPKCGVGVRQKAPFQIKAEPKLGKKDFVGLYWTWTTFATPRVFEAFAGERFTGYERWPVIIRRTGEPAKSVAQLLVMGETAPGLVTEDLQTETCPSCGQVKFNAVKRGSIRYRGDALPEGIDLVLSHEWWGSGAFAYQEVFVSKRAAHLMVERGWQGVVLHPLQLE